MRKKHAHPWMQALLLACATVSFGQQPIQAQSVAPGGPGGNATWLPADKIGFGTSHTTASNVWFTLEGGRLSELYYPDLSTPSARNIDFVVTDGQSFATRAQDVPTSTRLVNRHPGRQPHRWWCKDGDDPHSLTYQIVNTDAANHWRLTTTFVTDPARPTLLIGVEFTSLDGRPYQLYAVYQPQLGNPPLNAALNESGITQGDALLAADAQGQLASALVASPAFSETSNGYLGTSDGETDLSQHYRLTAHYDAAPNGTVVQTGRLPLTGLSGAQRLTLALGFGAAESAALDTANASLGAGFFQVAQTYAEGWDQYLDSLRDPPWSLFTPHLRRLYAVSVMVLAASEDKLNRGAFIASPSMPWAFGTGLAGPSTGLGGPPTAPTPSTVYHLVWSRDTYEIATALIAAGDQAAAARALAFLFNHQQMPNGGFPSNSTVDGTPVFNSVQLDEDADPIILAYQLGIKDATTWSHAKRAADFIVNFASDGHSAPWTLQERWEEQPGYSPATIATEIAGLVCAADLAQANGDAASAQLYLSKADLWQSQVETWTVTHNGPYSRFPYFLRLSEDGDPNVGTTYNLFNGGPSAIDQRRVVDASFLELVRLGVKPGTDPAVVLSLPVVDAQLAVTTPHGTFWHRYNFDGYGNATNGGPWFVSEDDTFVTRGRLWPITAGERGEYDLAVSNAFGALRHLIDMGNVANEGYFIPEQLWDNQPPSGQPGFEPGTPTTSATPLAWSHAQFIRLAWDIAAGRVVEQPAIVAARYLHHRY
jgi:glucoamylase